MKKTIGVLQLIKPIFIAVLSISIAAGFRLWPLQSLGMTLAWLTFYPAVMGAALFGGIISGLLAAVLSCLTIYFLWPLFGTTPFIKESADWLGMVVFFLTSTMISIVVEMAHRANKRAKKAQEQAEAANKAKSVFLANMSHELRTPLNAILGFSRILKNSADTTHDQRENLEIITRSGEHLLNLINNILDISKIESGRVVLEPVMVDMFQLLTEIKSLMYVKAVEKGLSLKMEQSPELPRLIIVDAGKLRQVLINLIGNAIKFTQQGGITIKAGIAKKITTDYQQLKFEINDTGIGIKVEDTNRIFDSFVQVKGHGLTEAGTGLGLTICKQNIRLLGGEIGVKSELGKGSNFSFEIPVKVAPKGINIPNPLNQRVIGLKKGQAPIRLLITEDQPENRLLLQKLLSPVGFELKEAIDGKEAIAIFEEWNPNLIWMDMRMQGMDGMEATRIIKSTQKGANTKIIALTAHALEEERKLILDAGCDDFIRKPFRDTEIFDALEKHLGVKFVYESNNTSKKDKDVKLDGRDLQKLPKEILIDLGNALSLLDENKSLEVVNRIDIIDSNIARILRTKLLHMKYSELINVLENIDEENS